MARAVARDAVARADLAVLARSAPTKGTQVPGSINAATRDADTTFQLRSRNECLCDCTYEGNPIGLQRAICHILQIEHDHGGGPRRKLYQRMPHEESGDFRAVGKMWASKITEISKDYQSVAPPHSRSHTTGKFYSIRPSRCSAPPPRPGGDSLPGAEIVHAAAGK